MKQKHFTNTGPELPCTENIKAEDLQFHLPKTK